MGRSAPVPRDEQVGYVHLNPVKAGYVDAAEDYRWSSARLVLSGKLSLETGLSYEDVVASLRPVSSDGRKEESREA